ncbi:MAG: DNA translocase FtsK [Patescibacteria group bacterium]|nr:DNA translocase FtsK [Patescibacteria group bacterium]
MEDPNDAISDEDVKDRSEKEASPEDEKKNSGVFKNIFGKVSEWKLPPVNLLEKNATKAKPKNLEKNAKVVKKTLHDFGIEVEISGYNVGPTVVQYTFKPAVGVKLSRILALQNDLALALAAHSVRIEAPIPGKSLVGVEVPLPEEQRAMVKMRSALETEVFKSRDSNLTVILGEDVNGDLIIGDIKKMPHLMIAGATNTGKSVSVNSILTTLLYQNSPEELKFIMVDPKRVELSFFNGIPHLLTSVIVDTSKVINALKWAVNEMERRYKVLQDIGSKDIHSYNEKVSQGKKRQVMDEETGKYEYEELEKMPFIVIVIDELADLMAAHGKEVEGAIVRLAQMARAVGIHLVLSTQRPSVEVLTGLIKANIGTRIAFQVATQIDSRTILDMGGAEKLLGNGDMLFSSTSSPKPKRIQGVFISENEIRKVVKFIKKQSEESDFDEQEDLSESLEEQLESSMGVFSGPDTFGDKDEELFEEARHIIIENKKASTSLLQRKLSIGYSRAARLMDMLEESGVVGPAEGTKPRQILTASGESSYEDDLSDQAKRDRWS